MNLNCYKGIIKRCALHPNSRCGVIWGNVIGTDAGLEVFLSGTALLKEMEQSCIIKRLRDDWIKGFENPAEQPCL